MLPVHKPPKQNSQLVVEDISQLIDRYSRFDNVMVIGYFKLDLSSFSELEVVSF